MSIIKVSIDKIYGILEPVDLELIKERVEVSNRMLSDGSGDGNDFLGWVDLPEQITPAQLDAVNDCAKSLASLAEVIVVIGIGGSYLGAKAVLEAMSDPFQLLHKKQDKPIVLFAGQNLSEDYLYELLAATKPYKLAAIVISKSGTTTEPAVAFRIVKEEIETVMARRKPPKRIVAVTDAKRGALRTLATQEGYATFVIPDDIGGRYSVLTPVGLLPLAVAGINIGELVRGAQDMAKMTGCRRSVRRKSGRSVCGRAERFVQKGVIRSRYWPATIRGSSTCPNGGSSFTGRAKGKKAKVSSRQRER